MKRILLYLFVSLFLPNLTLAQKETNNKILNEAQEAFEYGDYAKALPIYKTLFNRDTTQGTIALQTALCYYKLRISSDSTFKYAELAAIKGIPEGYFYMGKIHHTREKFTEAINCYNHYQTLKGNHPYSNEMVQKELETIKRAQNAIKNPIGATVANMGNVINTPYNEYVPLLTADENTLIFTSRRPGSSNNKLDEQGNYFEDIYITTREAGVWQTPVNIGAPINTDTHDAAVSISGDGQTLLFYRTSKDKENGDIYSTTLTEKKWNEPLPLGKGINTEYLEPSANISLDNQTIFFSSNRPGGYGGKDLYMARLLPTGEWGIPTNLGPTINTPEDEDAPFLHADGITLYFSSKGHNTIGGYDVYATQLSEEGYWTEPENMGYPLNTCDDDIFFVISADGKRAYFSGKHAETEGGFDLYSVSLEGPDKYLDVITGMVTVAENDKIPLHAQITLIDEDNHVVSGLYNTNARNGRFVLLYNPNKKYKMIVEADGYHPMIRPLDHLKFVNNNGGELVLMLSKKQP